MYKSKLSVDIDRPIDEVFVYTRETRNYPQWRGSMTVSSLISNGPSGTGSIGELVLNRIRFWHTNCNIRGSAP